MTKRVIAIGSGGGHWQQLMTISPAFAHHDPLYVTTLRGLPEEFGQARFRIIPDCNRNEKLNVLRCAAALLWIMIRIRPHVVVTTGALPGVLALALARVVGARTIWIDSVANAEEMSMSGRLARRFATLWLSQWPDVAAASGADHAGSVL